MSNFLGPLAALGASFTWAMGVVAYSALSKKYTPYLVNWMRVIIGFSVFLVVLLCVEGPASFLGVMPRNITWAFVCTLSAYAVGDAFFMTATQLIPLSGALAIASIYPVWATLAGCILENQALSPLQIFSFALVLGGTIFVILSSPAHAKNLEDKKNRKWLGVSLAFLTSLAWALNSWAVQKSGQGISAIMMNTLRMGMALFMVPAVGVLMNGKKSLAFIKWHDIRPFSLVILFECVVGPFVFVYGLSHSPISIGSAFSALAPVISVPAALLMKQERFSWRRTLAVIAVVAGIIGMVNG